MLQDMDQHAEQLPLDVGELSSPLMAQILEFQDSELFSDETSNCTLQQNSDEASNCTTTIYTNISDSNNNDNNNIDHNNNNNNNNTTTNFSLLFHSSTQDDENNMSVSIEDLNSNNNNNNNNNNTIDNYRIYSNYLQNNDQQQFDDYSINLSNQTIPNYNLVTADEGDASLYRYRNDNLPLGAPLVIGEDYIPQYNEEEECFSGGMPCNYTRMTTTSITHSTSIVPYQLQEPDATLVDSYNPGGGGGGGGCGGGYFFLGTDVFSQELDFMQPGGGGDSGGILGAHTLQSFYNFTSTDDQLQPMINNVNESQQLVNGVVGNANCLTPDQISASLEDPSFKVGKLTAEERREKIHRYMKKRNERNFTKKLKYACRKTLADSRPRVRGRFAKNDELEMHRITGGINHEDDPDEDVINVRDEDDMIDSTTDILAHISGVDFFKCNNPLQSWI